MRERIIIHVDMDAFYASIEQLDNPGFRGRPVVVGADPRGGKGRGVVCAASYEARTFGIHSALPISTAYRLCPDAVFVLPRFERYMELSGRVMGILNEFSPLVEPLSVDEAFLDCTGTERVLGKLLYAGTRGAEAASPGEIARMIKAKIKNDTLLTASVGVAGNKSVAKIASELGKPDGLVVCPMGKEREFLANLPLKHLWGAGGKTLEKLRSFGFTTIGHAASSSPEFLAGAFGKHGAGLWELANGIDDRPVVTGYGRKSISEETTFERDVASDRQIEQVLFRIADSLTREMRSHGLRGRTITLKIRLEGFETFTRSRTLASFVNDTFTVRETARELYRQFDRQGKRVRLVGIGVSNLFDSVISVSEQLDLFHGDDPARGQDRTGKRQVPDALLDSMKGRYGEKITRAAFLPGLPPKKPT